MKKKHWIIILTVIVFSGFYIKSLFLPLGSNIIFYDANPDDVNTCLSETNSNLLYEEVGLSNNGEDSSLTYLTTFNNNSYLEQVGVEDSGTYSNRLDQNDKLTIYDTKALYVSELNIPSNVPLSIVEPDKEAALINCLDNKDIDYSLDDATYSFTNYTYFEKMKFFIVYNKFNIFIILNLVVYSFLSNKRIISIMKINGYGNYAITKRVLNYFNISFLIAFALGNLIFFIWNFIVFGALIGIFNQFITNLTIISYWIWILLAFNLLIYVFVMITPSNNLYKKRFKFNIFKIMYLVLIINGLIIISAGVNLKQEIDLYNNYKAGNDSQEEFKDYNRVFSRVNSREFSPMFEKFYNNYEEELDILVYSPDFNYITVNDNYLNSIGVETSSKVDVYAPTSKENEVTNFLDDNEEYNIIYYTDSKTFMTKNESVPNMELEDPILISIDDAVTENPFYSIFEYYIPNDKLEDFDDLTKDSFYISGTYNSYDNYLASRKNILQNILRGIVTIVIILICYIYFSYLIIKFHIEFQSSLMFALYRNGYHWLNIYGYFILEYVLVIAITTILGTSLIAVPIYVLILITLLYILNKQFIKNMRLMKG